MSIEDDDMPPNFFRNAKNAYNGIRGREKRAKYLNTIIGDHVCIPDKKEEMLEFLSALEDTTEIVEKISYQSPLVCVGDGQNLPCEN